MKIPSSEAVFVSFTGVPSSEQENFLSIWSSQLQWDDYSYIAPHTWLIRLNHLKEKRGNTIFMSSLLFDKGVPIIIVDSNKYNEFSFKMQLGIPFISILKEEIPLCKNYIIEPSQIHSEIYSKEQ